MWKINGFIFASLLIVFVIGCDESKTEETTTPTATVERKDLEIRVTATGRITPKKKGTILAPYNGFVQKVFVAVGDLVKTNDRLVTVSQSQVVTGSSFPIRAPFSGIVSQVVRDEGEYVTASGNDNLIMRIDDISELWVEARVPEANYNKLKIGQDVVVRQSTSATKSFKGRLEEIFLSAIEQNNWRRQEVVEFPIKIKILNPDDSLRPGMSVIFDVIAEKKQDVLVLPHEYIERKKDKYVVTKVSGEQVEVGVGLKNQYLVEVRGLQEGETIRQVDFYQSSKKD